MAYLSFRGVLVIVLASCAGPSLVAQTYDAEDEFSEVSNPSPGGIWRYGWSEGLTGPLELYDHFVPAPQYDIWHDPENTNPTWLTPLVQHNPNDTFSGPHPPHSLSLHPSKGGQYSHVRFTAPAAGAYSITAAFSEISGASTDVHIVLNNALPTLFSGFVVGPDGDEFSTCTPIALSVGDTIDFAVGFGNGSFLSDSTRLEATISLVDDCPGDIAPQPGGDGAVNVDDLLAVINAWSATSGPADINCNGIVNVDDLLTVINSWGECK